MQGKGVAVGKDFRLSLPDPFVCQVLTIAATEPISLLHSKPPKPTQARGKLQLLRAPGGEEVLSPEVRGPAPEAPSSNPAGPSAAGDLEVDFEKIYKYLSSISRSCHGPELSAAGENGRGGGDCEGGVPCGKPCPPLITPFSIHHQSQLWSLICSWHFPKSCLTCPAQLWLSICWIHMKV